MPTGDDDWRGLSWNRGEEASGFKSLITGQVGKDTSMKDDIYPDKMLLDEFEGFLAICDPSHLEKPARCHLIKGGVCAGFSESCEPLSLTELPEVLNLPRIVFSDLQSTKMNEKLPRKLFTVNNIHLCLGYGLVRIFLFLFPVCLFDTVIFEERIYRSDRLILLKSCLAYFIMILDWPDQTDEARALPQRPGKYHPRIALWNRTFLVEMISTVFVHIRTLMNEADNDVDLFRLGSLPLERIFGALQQRSRDNHTFERAMKHIPTMQFLRFSRADHYRIARRLKFDHMVCWANSTVPQCLFAVNPIRWARDALRLLRDETEFRRGAVYFICTCIQLETMVQAATV
jgi:hypothetical protein